MSLKQGSTEWQEKAKLLQFGQKRKIPHCTPDASAYISNSPRGVSIHCFRCGENDFKSHGRLSASYFLAMRQADEEEAAQAYPDVEPLYGEGVPVQAHLWVLRAGLTPERATDEYGFGWSDRSKRVVVPILHNGTPTGMWTARATDERKPKYLMPKGTAGASWYDTHGLRRDRDACVVVVEDVLSAIRVAEAGHGALAVLGTSVGPTQANLIADYPVVGWFDGDKAGRDGFVKLRKALGPYGVTPARVQSEQDPKLYSLQQINQYIEDAT